MVFLVVESSPQVRESLCHVLLSFGIRGVGAADRTAAREVLQKHERVEGAIVDIDNHEVDGIALLADLRNDERTRGIPLIVHTIQSSKDAVTRMVEMGVAGYLLKPYSAETAKGKLTAVFSKIATHNSDRRHIRVKPDPDEIARVSFRVSPPTRLVSGRIVDISLGGMALELFTDPPERHLAPGARIPRIAFSLAGRELTPSASVILLKARVLALKFGAMSAPDTAALERYIFKSISS